MRAPYNPSIEGPLLMRNMSVPNSYTLAVYVQRGGYQALKKAVQGMGPDDVTKEVLRAGLRGRGGAGFPTGMKWSFVPKDTKDPIYLCCNADESEPGTFKDKAIMEKDPHLLLEGMAIACYALRSHTAYVYIRDEYPRAISRMEQAVAEARAAGYLGKNVLGKGFDLEVYVHVGAGAYICGEETGLLESLEGKRAWPRIKPPFPATRGVFKKPTVVNNVETLANVPIIIQEGADWYAAIGTPKNSGPKLYCLSGHVNTPGLFEAPMGLSMKELIFQRGGGLHRGRRVKCVFPGGSSSAVLGESEIDVKMDFDSLAKAGSSLGSCGTMVFDDHSCAVRIALNTARFYAHESCGECTPCREGCIWLSKILARVETGHGMPDDPDVMLDICDNIEGHTICFLGDSCAIPVRSLIKKFRDEFDEHVRLRGCPYEKTGEQIP